MDSLDCGGDLEQRAPDRQVITDAEAFRAAFSRAHPSGGDVPVVDFEKYAVLAVFRGSRPQCGSTIAVKSVRDKGDRVEVTVLTRDACGGDDALSSPFSFVRIPRISKPHSLVELAQPGQSCG